jgi:putative endonuclease
MVNNIKIGQIGENIACRYLLNNNYKIVERNARYPWGEIDIVAKDTAGILVFVEVKTLKVFYRNVKHSEGCFTPEENLHISKLNKVRRTASLYANSHHGLIDENRGWRIDLLAIEINHPDPENIALKQLIGYSNIRHYENL